MRFLNQSIKKFVCGTFALVMVIVGVGWMILKPPPDFIEDTKQELFR